MKKYIFFSLIIFVLNISLLAQTKPATTTTTKKTTTTTTVKKAPTKTTTTKKSTTVAKPTTAKPATTTTAPVVTKPVEAPKEVAAPVEEPKKQTAPVTGPVGEGPKSYSTDKNSKTSPAKTTSTTKTTKTVAPKPEKVRSSSADVVRSYIGIRGGYNLGTAQDVLKEAGISTAIEKYEPGYMGGLVINLGISKAFSIQPEILYSQQGVRIEEGTDYISAKTDIVNVPLLLKLAFGSPKIKFFINAGPYIGYKLSQTADVNFGGFELKGKQDFVTEYDAIDGTKDNRFDFGGIGGAGFQFNLGGPLLTLEGRYQYGMADPQLYKDGKPAEVGSLGHSRVITGTVGLLFPIGGR